MAQNFKKMGTSYNSDISEIEHTVEISEHNDLIKKLAHTETKLMKTTNEMHCLKTEYLQGQEDKNELFKRLEISENSKDQQKSKTINQK
jgi:hypothetical protein